MCEKDFQDKQLDLLRKILAAQETANYIDQDYNISASKGFFLDYKRRRHLYMFSPTSLTLLLPDIGGQLAIAANNWTDISFREGLQVFTSASQTTDVLVHVRASDETIAGASVGGLGQSVTQGTTPWVVSVSNANANGQQPMAGSQPVVLSSNQSAIPVTQSGSWSNTSIGTTGAAVGSVAALIGGSDGTNLQPLAVNTSGQMKTALTNISGNAVSTGNGTQAGGGTQRVTIASDSTGQFDLTDRWARQAGQVDIARVLGGVLSATNPMITETVLQQFTLDAKCFTCSTGKIAAAVNDAASWFSGNTSTKNKLIWSIRVTFTNANQPNETRYITTDDATIAAGTSVIGNVLNHKGGGGAPDAATVMHYAAGVTAPAVAAATLPYDFSEIQSALALEIISPGSYLYIPAGTAGGVACYSSTTAAQSWSMTVRWIEF